LNTLDRLIKYLSRLPGVGKKSASRIAYYLLKQEKPFLLGLGTAVSTLKDVIIRCSVCGSFTETDPCPVCSDPRRDPSTICVIEESQDVYTIESTHEYSGMYHVLGGVISPIEGIGPKELNFDKLIRRVREGSVNEVILALNPTVEGDTTALYIVKALKDCGVRVTKLASGLPVGGDLEYAGALTLSRSLKGRTEFLYEEE